MQRVTFEGHPATLWRYVVDGRQRRLRRDALFFTDDGGRRIRIVTQAPGRQYPRWAATFAATRGSYRPY